MATTSKSKTSKLDIEDSDTSLESKPEDADALVKQSQLINSLESKKKRESEPTMEDMSRLFQSSAKKKKITKIEDPLEYHQKFMGLVGPQLEASNATVQKLSGMTQNRKLLSCASIPPVKKKHKETSRKKCMDMLFKKLLEIGAEFEADRIIISENVIKFEQLIESYKKAFKQINTKYKQLSEALKEIKNQGFFETEFKKMESEHKAANEKLANALVRFKKI